MCSQKFKVVQSQSYFDGRIHIYGGFAFADLFWQTAFKTVIFLVAKTPVIAVGFSFLLNSTESQCVIGYALRKVFDISFLH